MLLPGYSSLLLFIIKGASVNRWTESVPSTAGSVFESAVCLQFSWVPLSKAVHLQEPHLPYLAFPITRINRVQILASHHLGCRKAKCNGMSRAWALFNIGAMCVFGGGGVLRLGEQMNVAP